MKHDSINYIQYEKDRLIEIYSLLYPNEHILLLVNEVNISEVIKPKKIDLLLLEQIKEKYPHAIVLHIGSMDLDITRAFSITIGNANSEPTYQFISVKQNVTVMLKKMISFCLSFFPLLHEIVLEWYFKQSDKRATYNFNKIATKKFVQHKKETTFHVTSNALLMMHWLGVGGAEKFAVQTTALLKNANLHPFIIVSHISQRFYFNELANNFTIYELDRQIPLGQRIRFIILLINTKGISLVHNHHSSHFYRSLPFIKQISNSIMTIDSLHIDEKNRHKLGFPRRSIVWTNFIDYHHVISKRLSNLLHSYDILSDKIIYGHLGQDLDLPASFNIEKSLSEKKLTFCFVGRMSTQKRPLMAATLFISAIRLCRKYAIKPSVNVVGEGFYLPLFKNTIKYAGLSEYVCFFPGNSDVKSIMRQSDLLLISSENEGLTLVAFEALKEGCLVISTDVGAQNELIPTNLLLPPTIIDARSKWIQILFNFLKNSEFRNAQEKSTRDMVCNLNKNKTAYTVLTDLYLQQSSLI